MYPLFLVLSLWSCHTKNEDQMISSVALQMEESYRGRLNYISQKMADIAADSSLNEMSVIYITARDTFKVIEPVMQFTDTQNYKYLNGPNLIRIEEEDATAIKHLNLTGFQVLEEVLFDEQDLSLTKNHAAQIRDRTKALAENVDFSKMKKHHFLWMIRDGFLRVGITGITPFDSPSLGRQLRESTSSLEGVKDLVEFSQPLFSNKELYSQWISSLEQNIKYVKNRDKFKAFDYVKGLNSDLIALYNKTVKDWNVEFPFELAIANQTNSLYSENTFNTSYFAKRKTPELLKEMEDLGQQLFNDVRLSKDSQMSCASCHQKEKYFTDGKVIPFEGTRNTPTMLYAGLQQSFFYEGRSGSLEGQIISVINNQNEFHSSPENYISIIAEDNQYQKAFQKIFNSEVNDNGVRDAIASYIRSLAPFNSKFDRNMRGEEDSFTDAEKRGFNLFMGKAQCATCHFTPLFNGTVPMKYAESELELLGVPKTKNLDHTVIDPDAGRFNSFQTEEKRFFFKTPTIRNIAMTAPYMHNGVFETLEEVIEFYDRGGGNGLGFNLEYQTLPSEPLNLKDHEKSDLIAFMKTLTDEP
ncbi:cytochrome-c peroxidase [Jiulongibacter sp. NS-SX5]|uniref:cytochrome-c peroxidase n=1 Tax=Jiulongibacter sp. NS-SX5 TaxID=3463854 RepID=UPI0040584208